MPTEPFRHYLISQRDTIPITLLLFGVGTLSKLPISSTFYSNSYNSPEIAVTLGLLLLYLRLAAAQLSFTSRDTADIKPSIYPAIDWNLSQAPSRKVHQIHTTKSLEDN